MLLNTGCKIEIIKKFTILHS